MSAVTDDTAGAASTWAETVFGEPARAGGEGPLEVPGPPVAGEDEAGAAWQLADERLGDGDPVQAGVGWPLVGGM